MKKLIALIPGKQALKMSAEEIYKHIKQQEKQKVPQTIQKHGEREQSSQPRRNILQEILAEAEESYLIGLGVEANEARRISKHGRFKNSEEKTK